MASVWSSSRQSQRGVAMVMALVFTFVLLLAGSALIQYVVMEYRRTHADADGARALAAAEAGVDLAMDVLSRRDLYPIGSGNPLDDGWNFRGAISRSFGATTYSITVAGATTSFPVDMADVIADTDGGFEVFIADTGNGTVQVRSFGFANGATRAVADTEYEVLASARVVAAPLPDAIRARGAITFNGNGSGTQPVALTDTNGNGTLDPGEMELLDTRNANVRSLEGSINGPSGRVRGSATVYRGQAIVPMVEGIATSDPGSAPASMQLPSPGEMEANRQQWFDAVNRPLYGWADISPAGAYTWDSGTGRLTIGKNETVRLKAPAYLGSLDITANGATLTIEPADDPARNIVYIGDQTPVDSAIANTTQVVDIGNHGALETSALLVVNGRMESYGDYMVSPELVNSAIADIARLGRAGLVVLGDNSNKPALRLQSHNQASTACGFIYSAGDISMHGNGYVTGALMADGDVTFGGSGCRVFYPVDMFAPAAFGSAAVISYQARRSK